MKKASAYGKHQNLDKNSNFEGFSQPFWRNLKSTCETHSVELGSKSLDL